MTSLDNVRDRDGERDRERPRRTGLRDGLDNIDLEGAGKPQTAEVYREENIKKGARLVLLFSSGLLFMLATSLLSTVHHLLVYIDVTFMYRRMFGALMGHLGKARTNLEKDTAIQRMNSIEEKALQQHEEEMKKAVEVTLLF